MVGKEDTMKDELIKTLSSMSAKLLSFEESL